MTENDPNRYVGSVYVWDEKKVKEIMQDIVNFTKQNDKMMDYEKEYKEALERARQYHKVDKDNTLKLYAKGTMEYLFPVLKEESEDERIRKEIISALKFANVKGVYDKHIAWLEKQGEQEEPQVYETEDGEVITYSESEGYKVLEPKFKVGDWVVRGNITAQILDIQEQYYVGIDTNGNDFTSSRFLSDDKIHLWTIQDAKDGDVLVTVDGKRPFIYKGCLDPNHPDSPVAYCGIGTEGYFCKGGDNFDHWWTDANVQPATKEQCDLLFQKMKEAGYEWDAEKKELKIIDWSKHVKYEPIDPSIIEEKPVWTEEDEENLNQLHKIIVKKAYEEYEIDTEDETLWGKHAILDNWLKSLKDRVQPQWKPSEEQIQALEYQVNSTYKGSWQYKASKELLEQLKKL